MVKLIGHSLSHCVNDIAAGHVAYGDVEKIVARTRYRNPDEWSRGLLSYQKGAWNGDANATEIALRLLEEGKIDQPRLRGEPIPHIGRDDSHWTDAQTKEPLPLSPEQRVASAGVEIDRYNDFEEFRMLKYTGEPMELTERIAKFLNSPNVQSTSASISTDNTQR